MAAISGDLDESACSTPFVSASSSLDRDPSFSAAAFFCSAPSSRPVRDPSFSAAGYFYSAPASPARGGGGGGGGPGTADEYGSELGFNFDFSSYCPSPAVAAMSSADELFHNGQIRPKRLASFLLRPQTLPPLDGDDVPPPPQPPASEPEPPADERGRLRNRSVHCRHRSLSPFRARWLSPAAKSVERAAATRSSSSSSAESSASSSSSSRGSYFRRWGFFKGIFHRSKSDGGDRPPLPSNTSPKTSPFPSSPAAAAPRGRGRARRSAHSRLYEARRAEAEEMRRRTFLPYRHSVLLGFLGLGSRGGYGALHGLTAAAAAAGTGKARP